jgi:hypothetical protein
LNLDHLRAKVIEDIRREKAAKAGANGEAREEPGTYYKFLASHMGFFRMGTEIGVLVEQPHALVAHFVCPWSECSQVYLIAKFLSFREGLNWFHCCSECRERVMTLRDVIRVYPSTTYPIKKIMQRPVPEGAYEARCRQILERYEFEYIKFQHQRPGKLHEVVPETDYHRAITLRTTVEDDDDTRDHLRDRRAKKKILDEWGL